MIWPSVAPMSLQLWEGYFLRWVQTKSMSINIAERRRMLEIMTRNKEAQVEANRLRRQVMQLLEEAVQLGLIKKEEAEHEGEDALSVSNDEVQDSVDVDEQEIARSTT